MHVVVGGFFALSKISFGREWHGGVLPTCMAECVGIVVMATGVFVSGGNLVGWLILGVLMAGFVVHGSFL